MRSIRYMVWAAALYIFLVQQSPAKNRFPVFTYYDAWQYANKPQYYADLDSFGVSCFLSMQPDISAYYKDSLNLSGLDIFTNHWYGGTGHDRRIFLKRGTPEVTLYDGAVASVNGRISVLNQDAVDGYKCVDRMGSGDNLDPILNRYVWGATLGEDTAGYLLTRPQQGIFCVPSPRALEQVVRVDVRMRLLTTYLPPDTVVVRIGFTAWRPEMRTAACYEPERANDPRLATRLNDTLLLIPSGDSTVPDTFRTVSIGSRTIPFSYAPCDAPHHASGTNPQLPRTYANVCYLDGQDTICVFPYRFFKDVRAGDLANANQWYTISMDCLMPFGGYQHYFSIYWTGAGTLYVDSVSLSNPMGRLYDSLANNERFACADSIEKYYDTHLPGRQDEINGFYIYDEPFGMGFQTLERVKKIIAAVSEGYPKQYTATLGGTATLRHDGLGSQFFDTYIRYTQENKFLTDTYHNWCSVTSSSDIADREQNWQRLMDTVYVYEDNVPLAYAPAWQFTNTRRQEISNWKGSQVDYWPILPSYQSWRYDSASATWNRNNRFWTKTEMRSQINLALIYGAKGIGYWPYPGYQLSASSEPEPDASIDYKTKATAATLGIDLYSTESYADWEAASPPCDIRSTSPATTLEAIVQVNADSTVQRTSRWYEYRDMNWYLDSMAWFFNNASWVSAGAWTANVGAMSGSFLDSVRSLATYDSAYLHLGFFDLDSEQYVYVLNRRVDSLSYDPTRIDSQTVRLYFNDPPGCYEIWDVYANKADTVWDSAGVVRWDVFLNPGEARLVKRHQLHNAYWKGNLTANTTWPAFSTIRVGGDVTISSGTTLTINTNNVTVLSNQDSLSSGNDIHKVEFIVNGNLRLQGTASHRVQIVPDNLALDSSWYGIRTTSTGHLFVDNASIKKAYCGIKLVSSTADTVQNSRFEDCRGFGMYVQQSCFYAYRDTFLATAANEGVYGIQYVTSPASGWPKLSECYFQGVKYGIQQTSSRLLIQSCRFNDVLNQFGSRAIQLNQSVSDTISGCDIVNYEYGVYLGAPSTTAIIKWTRFTSDSLEGYGDCGPFMQTAIAIEDQTSPLTCKVQYCCFSMANLHHVWRMESGGTINLGSASWQGNNAFDTDSMNCGQNTWVPIPMVVNQGTGTLSARGNWWGAHSSFSGSVDTSNQLLFPVQGVCPDEAGTGKVLAGTELAEIPTEFGVEQNYPNPFNPSTRISYSLGEASHVSVEIYNLLGQKVATLVDGQQDAGEHRIVWNGRDCAGEPVGSGVYFYRVVAGGSVGTRKMLLIK